ncbi:hypothetical protein O1M63_10965 [Streptomyces mirabilis]|uniref:hypothetical protein n=1 Tax=Streptomyces mirabilis TaxID=68239 RepID=UPI0022CA43E2|nr:hypothetical protein [Streptomyces mirabilis]
MRAVGFRVNGGVEVLETLDLPDPVPTAGQVTVRVAFAGVNFAEIQHRRASSALRTGLVEWTFPAWKWLGLLPRSVRG